MTSATAVQWAFASLEAAIDALAEPHGIAIAEREAAAESAEEGEEAS